MKLSKKFSQIKPALIRHLVARNSAPYERVLKAIRAQGDIWITAQGTYMAWWQRRENALLKITVSEGRCRADVSLENAVIEKFPDRFLDSATLPCPETTFSGQVWITIDRALEKKELLIEILKREGILNFRIAETGDFMLSQAELGDLLDQIEARMRRRQGRPLEDDIKAIRQIVRDKLAACRLPLLRVWYHPRLNGVVFRAVFSARYDVDRAIINLAHIRMLEQKYDAPSTFYLRAFCPFYGDEEIKKLAAQSWCPEIALHGEFLTNAGKYGDEIKAAEAEKRYLEELTGRPIWGVGMHGGELTHNRSENTDAAIRQAGLRYDTTIRAGSTDGYFFPVKKLVGGSFSGSYNLPHALADVNTPARQDYDRLFYEQALAKMEQVYRQNGVFVMMLHPEYFGFFSYLSRPKSLSSLLKFLIQYLSSNRSNGANHR
jgi:peptidoglycan/xylan/chitin deacetylase (PgdA/CDA1 family)